MKAMGAERAAVVGGGIAGALSCLVLAQEGVRVDWYAPHEAEIRDDGAQARAYALAPGSRALLEALGVWNKIAAAQPVLRMEITQSEPFGRVHLSAEESEVPQLADMVPHADLLAASEAAVLQMGDRIHRLPEFETGRVGPQIVNDCFPKADLVIGADGANSRLRRAAGILWSRRDYEQTALVLRLRTERPHEGVACQWFGSELSPKGILALLPLADPHIVSMVYSLPSGQALQMKGQSPEALSDRITQDSHHRFGQLTALDERPVATPLAMTRAERVTLSKLLLLGDAAHTVHPLAGYGLNLGLQDLDALRQQLNQRSSGTRLGDPSLLKAYAARRSPAVAQVQWGLDAIFRLMQSETPGIAFSRSWGMRLLDQWSSPRQWLTRRALTGRL
ncbi:MAG: hypothetical protein RLY30_247 [Pseudomonadota bacterium]